jgi:uncharacterized membrane protein
VFYSPHALPLFLLLGLLLAVLVALVELEVLAYAYSFVSIGEAGVFDGVFLTGIIAGLLA